MHVYRHFDNITLLLVGLFNMSLKCVCLFGHFSHRHHLNTGVPTAVIDTKSPMRDTNLSILIGLSLHSNVSHTS